MYLMTAFGFLDNKFCRSASEFSLSTDFWPENSGPAPLRHPTADRVKPPKRRRPSSNQFKQHDQSNFYYIADADDVDNIDEHVRAEYVSSHSYLDSILSRVDTANVDIDNIEFPELGKSLKLQSNPGSTIDMGLKSANWGDNWKVDGIEKFEDQIIITSKPDATSTPKTKKSTTEIVPFLVPTAQDAHVIIGDQDLDNVSELSEKMSFEDSESDDDVIDAAANNMKEEVICDNKLRLLKSPSDVRIEEGRVLKMTVGVAGEKPIGKNNKMSYQML